MFNIKYNILVISQILFGLLNTIIFLKTFGVTEATDAYFITLTVIAFIQLFYVLPIEQFMFFYIEKKKLNKENANLFFKKTFYAVFVYAFFLTILIFIFSEFISSLFISNDKVSLLQGINEYFEYFLVGIFFMPLNYLFDRYLNAEMKFSIPYILENLYAIMLLCSYGVMYFLEIYLILYLVIAQALGYFIGFIFRFIIVSKHIGTFKIYSMKLSELNELKQLVKNSFGVGFSNIIYQSTNPIITNVLSHFESGIPTLFYYAQKILFIVYNVVVGPSLRIYQSKLSHFWEDRSFLKSKKFILKFMGFTLIMFSFFSSITYFITPFIFEYIKPDLKEKIYLIQSIFFSLAVWYLVVVIEQAIGVFVAISKNSTIYIINNTLFISIFSIFSLILIKNLEIYTIAISALIAQIVSFILYTIYAMRFFKKSTISQGVLE